MYVNILKYLWGFPMAGRRGDDAYANHMKSLDEASYFAADKWTHIVALINTNILDTSTATIFMQC